MQWSEFNPYVIQFVIGCPDPLIEQHARLAAIEFCRRTLCWQQTLDPLFTNGTDTLVELEPDSGVQFVKVKSVSVGGFTHPLTDSVNGLAMLRQGSQQPFCFTQDNKTLNIHPLQVAQVPVVIEAAMSPTLKATSFDDALGEYLHDIASGAIASLMRVPGQPWTDYNASNIHSVQFASRISTVSAKVSRGFMSQKMRGHSSYL